MCKGHVVVSPIAHSHSIAACELPTDWRFWQRFDRHMLERCYDVVVLMVPGWQWRAGIQAEVQIAGFSRGFAVRDGAVPIRPGHVT
jgi:hypothetical protein